MHALTLPDVTLHFRDEGPRDGPVLVFSNSLGTDLRVWDRLIPHLPPGLRIVRYDKRGHGLTSLPETGWGMEDNVADLAALMDALEIRGAVVCGLSVGGLIAQGLAAERPDLVRAMILQDTAAKIGHDEMWNERIAAVEGAGTVEVLADAILERWFSKAFRAEPAGELSLWRAMLVRTPAAGYAGVCRTIRDTDLRDSTARLTLPVLAMAGSEDGATPPDLVRETAGLIDGARCEVIRGAGHLPGVERPEEVAALVGAFLREVGHV